MNNQEIKLQRVIWNNHASLINIDFKVSDNFRRRGSDISVPEENRMSSWPVAREKSSPEQREIKYHRSSRSSI